MSKKKEKEITYPKGGKVLGGCWLMRSIFERTMYEDAQPAAEKKKPGVSRQHAKEEYYQNKRTKIAKPNKE